MRTDFSRRTNRTKFIIEKIAKITGVRQYKLRQIQSGKSKSTLEILQKIADGLGKSVKVQII